MTAYRCSECGRVEGLTAIAYGYMEGAPPDGWTEAMEAFVAESNRIEGIARPVTVSERTAHQWLWGLAAIRTEDLEAFVRAVAGRQLRRVQGMDVRVGNHVPPPGGPKIEHALRRILATVNTLGRSAYDVHVEYESLHPFMDGNGRSGRAVWAWMMMREGRDPFAVPFLHRWYYESLDHGRVRL